MSYSLSARRLKEALNDKKMKPQELSNLSGVNKSSLSQYINGSHTPSNISAGKIAKVLDVSPLWLMGFPDAAKIDVEELKTELIVTRLEYVQVPDEQEEECSLYEKKMDYLEAKIKDIEKINEKSKQNELIERAKYEDADDTARKINTSHVEVISSEAASKALDLYSQYLQAPENVRSAIDALLGSVPPKP